MLRRYRRMIHSAGFAALCCASAPAHAQPSLGTAENFAVLARDSIQNFNATTVSGSIGVGAGGAINGFPPGILTFGSIHLGDATAQQALIDIQVVQGGQIGPCGTELTGQDLGGRTLLPGSYCLLTDAELTGTLILDAAGDPNATFVFFIVGALHTADNSIIVMSHGGRSCNVTWVVGCPAALGANSHFVGTLVGLDDITLASGADVVGRLLARYGAVTLDGNSISLPECGVTATVATTWGGMKQIYR